MDIPLCHQPQIILTSDSALPLYAQARERFAAALAPDGDTCCRWSRALDGLPVGLALPCPPEPGEQDERPYTFFYMAQCKERFRALLHEDAAFYYVQGAPSFPALRAAVLALGKMSGRTVIAELPIEDDEGHMADGTEVCAAIGVLQCIGVSTVILTAHTPDALSEALEQAAPYARISVGVSIHSAWLHADTLLYNTELFLPVDHDGEARLLAALDTHKGARQLPRDHDDFILAPDGRTAHFIDPTIDISDEIEVGHRLEEALIDAEDDAGALKLVLETEDDLIALEEQRHMISRPVCLCAESAELLEKGLCVYPGLALYDGTWEQPEEVVKYLEQKYGLIRL